MFTTKRIVAAATATLLALGMSVGGASAAFAEDDEPVPVAIQETEKKVWVCKYVGTPGVNETLKTGGDGLINVSVNAIEQNQWDGVVPGWFSDAQDRSFVLKYSEFPGMPPSERPAESECPAADGPDDATPSADSTPENCLDGQGSITFSASPGVTYTVDGIEGSFGPSDTISSLSAGDYDVTAEADYGYVLVGEAMFTVTVEETEIDCPVDPIEAEPSAGSTPENCLDGEGTITFGEDAGVTYTVEGIEGSFGPGDTISSLSAGNYDVTAEADEGYILVGDPTFTVSVEETEIDCVLDAVEVNPFVEVSPFDCILGGAFILPEIDGVVWSVDGVVAVPGEYGVPLADTEVSIVAAIDPGRDDVVFADGATTEWELSFPEPEGGCLETFPLVEPSVSIMMPTCDALFGTYALSDTEGVTWFVNDSERAAGTYQSAIGTTVIIEAVADDSYGFGDEQVTEWTATFDAPTGCDELPELDTLALTGTNGALVNGAAYLAFLITLAGLAMVATRRGAAV